MTTSAIDQMIPYAIDISITEDTFGRTIAVPLDWYPRLVHGNTEERSNWRLIRRGHGIHWEDLDEDISVEGLFGGKGSGESQSSFKRWLADHQARTREK